MKNKKSLFFVILSSFVLVIPNVVNAATVGSFFSSQSSSNVTSDVGFSVNEAFSGNGFGFINTNLTVTFKASGTIAVNSYVDLPSIRQALAGFGSSRSVCDIGTVVVQSSDFNVSSPSYNFNDTVTINYSVSCPVNLTTSGFSGLYIYFNVSSSWSINEVAVGPWWTFVSGSEADVSASINNNWDNFNNTDIDSSDKESPDTSDYSDYQDAEDDLFNKMDNADISSLDVAIDANSSTWVWDRVTEWFNSNSLMMSFLISMLSIGIIKMALGR